MNTQIELYNNLLKVNSLLLKYPFNDKIKDTIELTKNQLELYYIKKYNICIESDKLKEKSGSNEKSQIIVFTV